MLVLTIFGVPTEPPEVRAGFDSLKPALIRAVMSIKALGLDDGDVAVHYPSQDKSPGDILKCIIMCLRGSPAISALNQAHIAEKLCEKIRSTLTVAIESNHALSNWRGVINVLIH